MKITTVRGVKISREAVAGWGGGGKEGREGKHALLSLPYLLYRFRGKFSGEKGELIDAY